MGGGVSKEGGREREREREREGILENVHLKLLVHTIVI